MYHTQEINQAPNQKNLHHTRFSYKHSRSDNNISHYTPVERQIHQLISSFGTHTSKKLSNAYIAEIVGCTTRTVTKATTKFHTNGLITKQQEHQYDLNTYNIIQSEYFYPKKDLILVEYFFSKQEQEQERYTDSKMRARQTTENGYKFLNKKEKEEVVMLNLEQKLLILKHRHDPKTRDIVNSPNVMAEIITPIIHKITTLLTLEEKEQFKLVAFPDDALEYAYEQVEPIVMGKRVLKKPVQDKVAWFMGIADKYCEQQGNKADWPWYYSLCQILGIDTKVYIERKPLRVNKLEPQKKHVRELSSDEQIVKLTKELAHREANVLLYGGIHGASTSDKKAIALLKQQIKDKTATKGKLSGYERMMRLPLDERIDKLRSELKIHEERLAVYNGPQYMLGLLQRVVERTRTDLNEAEKLECSNETQSVQYTRTTNSMAEGCEEREPELRQSSERQSFFWPLSGTTA